MKKLLVIALAVVMAFLPLEISFARGGRGGRGRGGARLGAKRSMMKRDSKKDQAKRRERRRIEESDSMQDEEIGRRYR